MFRQSGSAPRRVSSPAWCRSWRTELRGSSPRSKPTRNPSARACSKPSRRGCTPRPASVPVMLVLDDIHWADRPTLLLLRHLVHETARDAILIVGTYRSTDLDRSHPLSGMLADFRRDERVARLAVDGLTADGVAELLERAAGHELDEPVPSWRARSMRRPRAIRSLSARSSVTSSRALARPARWTVDERLHPGRRRAARGCARSGRSAHLSPRRARAACARARGGGRPGVRGAGARGGGRERRGFRDRPARRRARCRARERGRSRSLPPSVTRSCARRCSRNSPPRVGCAPTARSARRSRRNYASDLDAVMTDLAHHFGEAAAADPEKAVKYAARAGELAFAASAPDDRGAVVRARTRATRR